MALTVDNPSDSNGPNDRATRLATIDSASQPHHGGSPDVRTASIFAQVTAMVGRPGLEPRNLCR